MSRLAALACLGIGFFAPAAQADERDDCLAKLQEAERGGVIFGLAKDEWPWALVVNEAAWPLIPYGTKVAMMKTVDCAIAGPGKGLNIDVRGHRSNHVLGRWRLGRLTVE